MRSVVHPIGCKLLGDAKKALRDVALVSPRARKKHSAPEAECFSSAASGGGRDAQARARRSGKTPARPQVRPWQDPGKILAKSTIVDGLPNCSPWPRPGAMVPKAAGDGGSARQRLAPHTLQKLKKLRSAQRGWYMADNLVIIAGGGIGGLAT